MADLRSERVSMLRLYKERESARISNQVTNAFDVETTFALTSLTAFLTSSSEFSFATSSSRKAWTISCQYKSRDFLRSSTAMLYIINNTTLCWLASVRVFSFLFFFFLCSNQTTLKRHWVKPWWIFKVPQMKHSIEWVQVSCASDLSAFHTSSRVNRSSKLFCSFCVWQWRVFIFLCLFSSTLKKKIRNDGLFW